MTSRADPLTAALLPAELPRLYRELQQLGARAEGADVRWRFGGAGPETLLVLAAQAARQDPRLLWVLVELLARAYERFDVLALRRQNAASRWPAALAVGFEFARRARPSEELDDLATFLFRRTPKAAGEQFFLSTRAFAGQLARRDAEESLSEYKRWGYLSREEPLAKELGPLPRGTLGPAERRNLLRRLAERGAAFCLGDYIEALQGRASPRQASRDLANATFLSRRGTTRATHYRLRQPLR